MAIIKIHSNANYVTISSSHLRDAQLSWKAMGMLSFMLSCNDNFQFSIAGLTECSSSGKDATRSALKELKEKGYIVVTPIKDNANRIKEWQYDIYENPNNNSNVDFPDVDFPDVENRLQSIYKENTSTEVEALKKGGTDVPLSSFEDASSFAPTVSLEFEGDSLQGKDDTINYKELIKFWNETTQGVFGQLVCIENKRRAMTRARIREYGKANFAKAIENAAHSDFLRGATWFNYDWFIRPNNFVKVLENRYTDNGTNRKNANSGFDIDQCIRDGFALAAADMAGYK